MAWKDNLDTVFTITTGDGVVYNPLWIPSSKVLEWNVSEFEFPNQPGTLVKKLQPKGRKINLEFYFQGDSHLEVATAFEQSANDVRVWNISHPYYGNIICHCPSLTADNSAYGITKYTCTVIETITEDSPKISLSPSEKIISDKELLDETFVTAFNVTPSPSDVNTFSDNNKRLYREGSRQVRNGIQAQEYFNAFNTANSAISKATIAPLNAIRTAQAVINAPALFASSVQSRVGLLRSQFTRLRNTASTITGKVGKKIYENNAGGVVSAMMLAIANPQDGDFKNANQVLDLVSPLLDSYNEYIEDLDSLQTDNGGAPDSYIPDAAALIGLNNLVNFAISNLFTIALNAKQERAFILDVDSNWIVLTHRVYGAIDFDNRLQELIDNNEAGLNELLQVQKGRRIVYYV
jgi:hypothetical protein